MVLPLPNEQIQVRNYVVASWLVQVLGFLKFWMVLPVPSE